jgi:hypothetical protein
MREIHDHETNDANRAINVYADDQDPNNGNASHVYEFEWQAKADADAGNARAQIGKIVFQNGPIGEVGVNGITNEILLTIVIDRLRGFQSSKFACRENALALTKLEEAFHWLEARTRARERRGVEGTHKV